MKIRGLLYKVYSFLFDKEVVLNLLDIKKDYLSNNLESQKIKIKELLDYVTVNVPFYYQYKGKSLKDFPIVNKNIIKSNIDIFLSKEFRNEKLHTVTTSGSTGTPFKVIHDRGKRKRHTADNMFFMELSGYKLGSTLYYLRVWNNLSKHSKIHSFLTNIKQIEIGDLSENKLKELVRLFNKNEEKSILAFASTYEALYAYLKKKGIKKVGNNIQALVSMSEHLSEATRRELSLIFNAPVVSRYSNMENGFIAQQVNNEQYYIINDSSYKVELLDLYKDEAVEFGNPGRIVITDLYNHAMPLIRYDTGDLGVFEKKNINGKEVVVLSSVEGRVVDMIFNTNGSLVSPHVITNTMWEYEHLKQWQFVQIDKTNYKFILNGELTIEQKNKLEKTLKKYLGQDAVFSYEYVEEIPVLASGKRRKILNMYKKTN